MNKVLQGLHEKRTKALADARAILDAADSEKGLTDEQDAAHTKAIDESHELDKRIKLEQSKEDVDRRLAEDKIDNKSDPEPGDKEARNTPGTPEHREAAFTKWLGRGSGSLAEAEIRALQMDSDEAGGYTVAPEQFVNRLIKAVDDLVFIRGLATTQTVTGAHSLGAPSLDADPADADWTAEIATGSEDSTMDFGKRNMEPHPLAKRIKVSRKLIRASTLGIEALVIQRLGYKFGITQEKGFMTGSGAAQPLGIFTASDDGISTGRDVSTGNTTTSITFDGLKEAKYNQKANYWPRMRWIFHRDALKQIDKLKDGEGQYQWQASTQAGQPDMLMGFPFLMSEYAPNTFTTGLYVGMVADYSLYWIADALSMTIQRLDELYAETNQVGFIGRLETDGAPVLEEAFTRVTLA